MVVVHIRGHVIRHNFLVGGAHQAFQQGGGKSGPVLALVAVDQVGPFVFRQKTQSISQARLEVRGAEVHTQVQRLDLSSFKQGLVIGGVEAVCGDVTLDQRIGVGQIHDGLDAVGLGQCICVSGPAQLVIHGAAAAEECVFSQFSHCYIAEVGKYRVGGIVRPVIGAGELVDEILVVVAAGLLHGEGDGDIL